MRRWQSLLGMCLALGGCFAPGVNEDERQLDSVSLAQNDPGPQESAPFSAWNERATFSSATEVLSASLGGPCRAASANRTCYLAVGKATSVAVYALYPPDAGAATVWSLDETFPLVSTAVSVSGNRLAIANVDGVHVYQRQRGGTWMPLGSPIAPVPRVGHFGCSVALDGSTLVVGAHDYPNEGRAYVYELESEQWQLSATLGDEPGVGVATSMFGTSVGISAGTIAVGQPIYLSSGKIHIYTGGAGGWGLSDSLQPHDPAQPETLLLDAIVFGFALSISGDKVVGRSPHLSQIFERQITAGGPQWTYKASRSTNGVSSYHQTSVAVDGENVIIGEPELGGNSQGAFLPWKGIHPPPPSGFGPSPSPYVTQNPGVDEAEFGRVVAVRGLWLMAAAKGRVHIYTKVAF